MKTLVALVVLAILAASANGDVTYTTLAAYTEAAATDTATSTAAVATAVAGVFVETCNADWQLTYESTWSDASLRRLVLACPAETNYSPDTLSYRLQHAFRGRSEVICIPGDRVSASMSSESFPSVSYC